MMVPSLEHPSCDLISITSRIRVHSTAKEPEGHISRESSSELCLLLTSLPSGKKFLSHLETAVYEAGDEVKKGQREVVRQTGDSLTLAVHRSLTRFQAPSTMATREASWGRTTLPGSMS